MLRPDETAASGVRLGFGVLDQLDLGGRTPSEVFEQRLRLAERYDEAGFYAFHPTEHHGTPLSCAPSPNVLLAAIAARTTRLRLAPMVYILPLYSPIRLIEEICMLDHLSKGRLELGVGRGVAPFELVIHGVNPLESRDLYRETLEAVLIGLTNRTLTYKGHYHRFVDVPLIVEPYQKPHPPFWYGVFTDIESAVAPARAGWNIGTITPSAHIAEITQRFREEWRAVHGDAGRQPKIGVSRTVIVADTDERAMALGQAAHRNFQASLSYLWHKFAASPAHFPSSFEGYFEKELAICGSPDTVRREIERQARVSGANYFMIKFSYGDLSDEAVDRSIDLFVREVMPAFSGAEGDRAAAE